MRRVAVPRYALDAYYAQREQYRRLGETNEQAVREAFKTLLTDGARPHGWTLIVEKTLSRQARPDGTFLDDFKYPRGYWEAKDSHDDLDAEIQRKLARGYPPKNII